MPGLCARLCNFMRILEEVRLCAHYAILEAYTKLRSLILARLVLNETESAMEVSILKTPRLVFLASTHSYTFVEYSLTHHSTPLYNELNQNRLQKDESKCYPIKFNSTRNDKSQQCIMEKSAYLGWQFLV